MAPMDSTPRITTMYFYQVKKNPSGTISISRASTIRGPSETGEWWPRGVGAELENAGSVLVLENLPAVLNLGLRIVAHGWGFQPLTVKITPDADATAVVREYRNKIRFDPQPIDVLPDTAGLREVIPGVKIQEPGLYWVTAAVGDGPETRLPLYITTYALSPSWGYYRKR